MANEKNTAGQSSARGEPLLGTLIAYEITNTVTGKRYIGITSGPLEHRWTQHIYLARTRPARGITYAIAEYGPESFLIRHIASARTIRDLKLLERVLIAQEFAFEPAGYNLTKGGEGLKGLKHSQETRAKISASKMGHAVSDEARDKMSKWQIGRKVPPEVIAKRSATATGRRNTPDAIAKMSAAKMGNSGRKGMSLTPEHKARISAANTGRHPSEETRSKLSITLRGRKLSSETRAKMTAARTGKRHTEESKAKMRVPRAARAPNEQCKGVVIASSKDAVSQHHSVL